MFPDQRSPKLALEPVPYHIRSELSPTAQVNLTCKWPGEPVNACIWNVLDSPTQCWYIDEVKEGYLFRNAATQTYISYDKDKDPCDLVQVTGSESPIEWLVEELDSGCYCIKLASDPSFALDVEGASTNDGTKLILYSHRGGPNQQWSFHKVEEKIPFPHIPKFFLGAVPAGAYWLGCPDEKYGPDKTSETPSVAAITVAARYPLQLGETASLHLSAVGSAPWPNQVWMLEHGVRGYRFKNIGTDSYLNISNSVAIMDPCLYGVTRTTERLIYVQSRQKSDISDYIIVPESNWDVRLGCAKGDSFNTV